MPRPQGAGGGGGGRLVFRQRAGAGASAGADAEARPVVVRLSPEEAFYMAHQMDCLTVHGAERGAPPGRPLARRRAPAGRARMATAKAGPG